MKPGFRDRKARFLFGEIDGEASSVDQSATPLIFLTTDFAENADVGEGLSNHRFHRRHRNQKAQKAE